MSKKRHPGRPRKVGRPRTKFCKHKKIGRLKRIIRLKIKKRKKRPYHHKLDISILKQRFLHHGKKYKYKHQTERRDSSSYDASCYGTLSCDGKLNFFNNDLALVY
jgi:hypothetical protein